MTLLKESDIIKNNPIPHGYRSITPYLKLPKSGRLVEFLKSAFDGVERGRLLRPDGELLHAEVVIGDSLVMVHEALSDWDAKPSTLYLYVEDVDATYLKAIEAGGTCVSEPVDRYFGDRVACVTDVSGNEWWIATRRETPTLEEVQERATTFLQERM